MATGTHLESGKPRKRVGSGIGRRTPATKSAGKPGTIAYQAEVRALVQKVESLQKQVVELKKSAATTTELKELLKRHGLRPFIQPRGAQGKARLAGTVRLDRELTSVSAGGQAQLLSWVQDGTLIPSVEFAQRRGVERQALAKAVQRNALFDIKVNNRVYYPDALVEMEAADSAAICEALGNMSAGKKLLFLLREHGSLGGQTVADSIESKRERVLELARAWADEDRASA